MATSDEQREPSAPAPNAAVLGTGGAARLLATLEQIQAHLGGLQRTVATLHQMVLASMGKAPDPPMPEPEASEASPPAFGSEPMAEASYDSLPAHEPDQPNLAPSAPARTKSIGAGLVFRDAGAVQQELDLYPNGINGVTGQPLITLDTLTASRLARATAEGERERGIYAVREEQTHQEHLGLVFGISEDRLDESRWAIVIHRDESVQLLEALFPLIQHRSTQQGITLPPLTVQPDETCGQWLARLVPDPQTAWNARPPILLYHTGESSSAWLQRHGVGHGVVDPRRGVPYYLLIVGQPGATLKRVPPHIPFVFQYELDLFWAVGRLCFTDAEGEHILSEYRAYAEQVVAFEQQYDPDPPPIPSDPVRLHDSAYRRHFVLFGTRHAHDPATERSATELVLPLAQGSDGIPPIAERFRFSQQLFLGDQADTAATHANLQAILTGQARGGKPALLFTATHGIGLPPDDPQLVARQGALLCQDWQRWGEIEPQHAFASADLPPDTDVRGLIVCCFACYGAGCPEADEFVFALAQDGDAPAERPIIAPFPLISKLSQQLLVRGALAFIGHVDRAWTYSFSATNAPAQVQSFEDLLARLMAGKRVGFAMDQFNQRQGAFAMLLSNEVESASFGKRVDPTELSKLWAARNDARNYALLGDPAVRLPLAAMAA